MDLPREFPNLSFSKYYNVPIIMGNKTEEEYLHLKYFPLHKKLKETKRIFDPEGIFDQTQGIRMKEEFWKWIIYLYKL